jgi:hypothetical protein
MSYEGIRKVYVSRVKLTAYLELILAIYKQLEKRIDVDDIHDYISLIVEVTETVDEAKNLVWVDKAIHAARDLRMSDNIIETTRDIERTPEWRRFSKNLQSILES